MSSRTRVYIEAGAKRTFASAADWPGWCRVAKNENTALESLAEYAARYARVAKIAHAAFPVDGGQLEVVERLVGNATTDFGAPAIPAKDESRALKADEARRMRELLEACWTYLDQVVASSPASLRKGPRGGGRDRDVMFDHVLGAETEYAKKIGVRLKQPDGRDKAAVRAFHQAILDALANPQGEERWPVAYFARRAAWHALDHAWEMEDRS